MALEVPGTGEHYTGAVGELISALMQTAGLYTQSSILTHFQAAFQSIGILLFSVGIIGGIIGIALYQNYNKVMILLLGPTLFFWMISNPVEGRPTLLKVGNRVSENSEQDQKKLLFEIRKGSADAGNPKLAWFFVEWDNLVSSIMQGLVAFLVDTQNKEDLLRVARERVFSRVLMADGENRDFVRLVSMGTMGYCAKLANTATQLSQPNMQSPAPGSSDAALKTRLEEQYKIMNESKTITLDASTENYVKALGVTRDPKEPNVSCSDIWQYIHKGAVAQGQAALESATPTGQPSDIPWTKVRSDVQKVFAQGSGSGTQQTAVEGRAAEVIGAYLVKNVLNQSSHAAMTAQLTGRAPFDGLRFKAALGQVPNADARGEYLKLQYFANSIPYIQGMLLFLLSAGFPFFVAFLLVPGRASTFLVWMSLWVWVKSWDVGFAMIQFIRELMWQYVGSGLNRGAVQLDWADPKSIYALMYHNDPMAVFNTYISIIALLTVSVPVLTAQFCLGATNLYDAFKNSIDQLPTKYGRFKALGSRRAAANASENLRNARASDAATDAFVASMDNPARNSDGNSLGDSYSGSAAQDARAQAMRAKANYIQGRDGRRLQHGISVQTNRNETYGQGIGNEKASAGAARYAQKHFGGRSAAPGSRAGTNIVGQGSDRYRENDTKYKDVTSGDLPTASDADDAD